MKRIPTVCARDCYDSCFAVAEVDPTGKLVSLRADGERAITQGFMCPRGNKDAERVYTNRVLVPHVRVGAKPGRNFEKQSPDRALDLVAGRLGEVIGKWGPDRVLLLDYSGNMGLLASEYPKRLWRAIGATRTDYTVCAQSGRTALSLHYGLGYGLQPEEFPHRKVVVCWGFNPAVSSPHIWSLSLKARKASGGKIVVVDPRRSETAAQADLWTRPKPGSDVALAYGIARHLIQKGLVDSGFVKRWVHGFDAYADEAMGWTPARVQEATGLDVASVETLANMYSELAPRALMMGIGFQKSRQGAEAVRAISLLPALLGEHRGFFYANAAGYLVNHAYLTGASLAAKRPRVVSQVGLSDLVVQGEFKFIYVYGMNPALTLPNQEGFRKGLLREDVFLVVHETHWTETCEFADVVLPAQTYLEKEDVVIPWAHRYPRKSEKALEPLGQSLHEIDVMVEIAKRLDLEEKWLFEEPWKAVEKSLENAIEEGSSHDLLAGRPVRLRCRPRDEYQTPSGKIELSSSVAEAQGYSPLPMQIPLNLQEGEYLLLNSSDRRYTHTQFQDIYGPIPAIVRMNPNDARLLGAQDDTVVTLFNDLGKTTARVKVTDSVPTGVLWSPKQFLGLDGNPQNSLTESRPQAIGGGAVYNSTAVRIRLGE
jgi:anaerobic selenocysteine-containing dehydrogenase